MLCAAHEHTHAHRMPKTWARGKKLLCLHNAARFFSPCPAPFIFLDTYKYMEIAEQKQKKKMVNKP